MIGARIRLYQISLKKRNNEIQQKRIRLVMIGKSPNLLNLNEAILRQAITDAHAIYVFDDNKVNHALKDFFTFQYSSSYRKDKAVNREKQWIAALDEGQDPNDVLIDIFNGPGAGNLDSFKYQILNKLTGISAKDDDEADNMINRAINVLQPGMQSKISLVITK